MKNHDELINKYLDNDLESAEINELNDLVKQDSNFKMNFITQKYVHENLYDLPVQSAPANLAESIMSKILGSISVKYKKSYFFRIILSIFLLLIVASLFIFFFYALNLPAVQHSTTIVENTKNVFEPIFDMVNKVLTSEYFKTVSAAVGLIILIAFYFTLNSFKSFKDRLKQY